MSHADAQRADRGLVHRDVEYAAFPGYPYLATRIGLGPLRHVALLPAAWSRERIVALARRQAAANRLHAAACFGPEDAVYVGDDGTETATGPVPTGLLVVERLRLAEAVPDSSELAARRLACGWFAADQLGSGFMVGDGAEGGRYATAEERERLARRGPDGLPAGLAWCPACGEARGDFLRASVLVVPCRCRCENDNRCARCDGLLADHRLSSWAYNPTDGQAWYLAAYAAFSHRCPDESAARLA